MAYPPPPRHTTWLRTGVSAFTREEWAALVRLPGQVVVAVAYTETVPPKTVAQGLAGLEAVAAGRGSASALVRQVVAAIYTEEPGLTGVATAEGTAAGVAALAASARTAAGVLARHTGRADVDAYLGWLESIVSRTCQGRPGWSWLSGRFRCSGRPVGGTAERALLAALRAAFGR